MGNITTFDLTDLSREFMIAEDIVNEPHDERAHYLNLYYGDRSFTAPFLVEVTKKPDQSPLHHIGWQTNLSSEEALILIQKAHAINGFAQVGTTGEFTIVKYDKGNPEDPAVNTVYKWISGIGTVDDTGKALPVKLHELDSAIFFDLEIHDGDKMRRLVYTEEQNRAQLSVFTTDDIISPWIQEIYSQTVESRTKDLIEKHMESLVRCLGAFAASPFGKLLTPEIS